MNQQQLNLLNAVSEQCRHLKAEADEQKARLDKLVETMTNFKNEAQRLLEEMAAAHKPKESNDTGN